MDYTEVEKFQPNTVGATILMACKGDNKKSWHLTLDPFGLNKINCKPTGKYKDSEPENTPRGDMNKSTKAR